MNRALALFIKKGGIYMANLCLTDITIVCKDYEEAKDLYSLIVYCLSQPQTEEDKFGKGWVGFLVEKGLEQNCKNFDCRGNIHENTLRLNYDKVEFTAESSWTPEPILSIISKIVEKSTKEGEIIFNSEEPGCEIFATNDISLIGKRTGHFIEGEPITWEESEIYDWI